MHQELCKITIIIYYIYTHNKLIFSTSLNEYFIVSRYFIFVSKEIYEKCFRNILKLIYILLKKKKDKDFIIPHESDYNVILLSII